MVNFAAKSLAAEPSFVVDLVHTNYFDFFFQCIDSIITTVENFDSELWASHRQTIL